jgi:hypothetical protein
VEDLEDFDDEDDDYKVHCLVKSDLNT